MFVNGVDGGGFKLDLVKHYFREVLGNISMEEIISNNELVLRAKLIDELIFGQLA